MGRISLKTLFKFVRQLWVRSLSLLSIFDRNVENRWLESAVATSVAAFVAVDEFRTSAETVDVSTSVVAGISDGDDRVDGIVCELFIILSLKSLKETIILQPRQGEKFPTKGIKFAIQVSATRSTFWWWELYVNETFECKTEILIEFVVHPQCLVMWTWIFVKSKWKK